MVNLSGQILEIPEAVRRMSKTLRHRGPDGEGFWAMEASGAHHIFWSDDTPESIRNQHYHHSPTHPIQTYSGQPQLMFAHRRLSIIDLSPAGHQPFCTVDQQFWITYNGELYNYIELRDELKNLGCVFTTQTDTEVIINAYKIWGDDCLQRFNGMWAFVIYDAARKRIFGSRDRFGVKPFYYYRDKRIFCFASEQKALLKNPYVHTELNREAVADYFVGGEIEHEPEGFFKNIIELFPSCAFKLDLNTAHFQQWSYYSLAFNTTFADPSDKAFDQHVLHIRERLLEAIRIRLRSDVPVGACLSGGIDSSAITGIISHFIRQHEQVNVGSRLKLFTAVFDDPAIDERHWAKEVVQLTNADWMTTNPQSEELLSDLETLIYSQDVPIWSTSTYAQHRVMRLASDNSIKVLLDGQGGDELFAGYFPYFRPFWSELAGAGKINLLRKELSAFNGAASPFWMRETVKQRIIPQLSTNVKKWIQRHRFQEFAYLYPELTNLYYAHHQVSTASSLNEMLYTEMVNTRLKSYLKCEDRCSMWHGVESRTPFADDHLLIEAVFALPGSFKIRNGMTKALLRESASPWLPDSIRKRRDKMGYVTPNNQWIAQLRNQFRPYFEQDFDGILNRDTLLRDYDRLFNPKGTTDTGRLFKFIAFAVWRKVFGL
jgi:asparagine synthase (glutamine-hydrolysing)